MSSHRYVKLTILHSNDLHGDFVAEARGAKGKLLGGLAVLSGYLNQVRSAEPNVLYVICGDMVQGSIIDSEYRGVSTIELMNYLAPDVVTLGNHELDYGLAHLLFLEKMANFPIVNGNLYIKKHHKRLMRPYLVLEVGGLRVMFLGIITEVVLSRLRSDEIGTYIGIEEARAETGRICNAYRASDVDLTVLLTHIGFEEDVRLAASLDPAWGVDMILGGHSHTILERPEVVNDILIAQAGVGTDQIGRFDVVVDSRSNRIAEWTWQLVPVDEDLAEPDHELQRFVDGYQQSVDQKYSRIICRVPRPLAHSTRMDETELGNLMADILLERSAADVALLGGGAIGEGFVLGPLVTLGSVREMIPYDGPLVAVPMTGAQLAQIFEFFMSPENHHPDGKTYQVSRGVRAVYDGEVGRLDSLSIDGVPVGRSERYEVCLLEHHYRNSAVLLGMAHEELTAIGRPRIVATSLRDVVEEHLTAGPVTSRVEGRLEYR